MLEYASMRLTDSWRPAMRFATVIVRAASVATTGGHPAAHDVHASLANEIGGPGRAVKEREAVEEQRCRERSQQEVLERALGRARARATEGGHRVRPDAHRLESEEERQRVAGGGEHHRAERREEDERIEL